jgi:hypothetical protein
MCHVRHAVLAFGFALAVTAPLRADDAADARAIIEKAVKAHGGQDNLDKFTGHVTKFKGTLHAMGMAIPMTGEISMQGNDKVRVDVQVEAGGMKFHVINVVAGDKGWAKIGDDTKEMSKDELTEGIEQAHSGWVTTLAPLKGKEFKLSTVGEIMINDRPALGVKVATKGRRDVDLYFDKETGMLVKSETRVKDEGSGQEVTEESFPSDYKDVQGTKQSMKFTIKRDGKPFMEGEASEMSLVDKLDANLFTKP